MIISNNISPDAFPCSVISQMGLRCWLKSLYWVLDNNKLRALFMASHLQCIYIYVFYYIITSTYRSTHEDLNLSYMYEITAQISGENKILPLVSAFIYFNFSCMLAANVLVRMCRCTGTFGPQVIGLWDTYQNHIHIILY